jgi:hypothetical protein
MPKNKVSEYDVTPSSNSDMAGIDISEGCSPAGINDAIRAGMSHLKKMDDGTDAMTSPVFTTATMSGGTINSAIIGGSTKAAGSFTDLVSDTFTLNSVAIGSADFTKLAGINASAVEINSLVGASSTTTMQAQMDAKAPLVSPTFTGAPVAPTQSTTDNSTRIATTAYVTGKTSEVQSSVNSLQSQVNGLSIPTANTLNVGVKAWTDGSGGLQIRYGSYSSSTDGNQTVLFTTPFDSECFVCIVGGEVLTKSVSRTDFLVNREDSYSGTITFQYIALGR